MTKECFKVSVIVPVFNIENYVGTCINSLLDQTYDNYELIIVNDGSTDKSLEIVNSFLEKFPNRIKVISKENGGLSSARNCGLEHASGDYISFVDGDDFVDIDYLEKLIEYLDNGNIDVVISGHKTVKTSGELIDRIKVASNKEFELYGKPGVFISCAKLYKKEFLFKNNLFFPVGKLYEDIAFSFYTKYLATKVIAIPYCGYNYVQRDGSIMHNKISVEKFPFEELCMAVNAISNALDKNTLAYEYFEYDILYFFSGFIFLYCKKQPIETIEVMCNFAENVIEKYFPLYYKNSLITRNKQLSLSWVQKVAVFIFVKSIKHKKLNKIASIITR